MSSPNKQLECPFTWRLDHQILADYYDEDCLCESRIDESEQPIVALIDTLLNVFVNVKLEKLGNASKNMDVASSILKRLDNNGQKMRREHISRLVATHIVEATRYHYLKAAQLESEASKVLEGLSDLEEARHKYQTGEYTLSNNGDLEATLNGCKAIAWAALHEAGHEEAIHYSQKALQTGSSCALWHFILGKNLRRHRRYQDFNYQVSADEEYHLMKAYQLDSSSSLYGVFAAQMYREKRKNHDALKIYTDLYETKPESVKVRLRLALAFIRMKKFQYAKECLDYVQELEPTSPMFLHYKGIYFEAQKDYKIAAIYLEKSAILGNFTADLQHAEILFKMNKDYDIIGHLNNIIEKCLYRKASVQQITLHIAMHYYCYQKNLKETLNSFAKAIKIDPNSKQLKNYSYNLVGKFNINIYDLLRDEILPEFIKVYGLIPENMRGVVNEIQNFCMQYSSNLGELVNEFRNL